MSEVWTDPEISDEAVGAVWHRAEYVAEIGEISFPQRTIDVIVMPYETPTRIKTDRGDFEEIVSRGAFAQVQQRAGHRLKVNRDHDPSRPVGVVKSLYPNREDGLFATMRISKTVEGTDTLELASDGILGASAGFGLMQRDGKVRPDAMVWESKSRCRLNHIWLDHVALVSNPAYPTAEVVDVRSAAPTEAPSGLAVATPNLDRIRALKLQEMYDLLSR